MDYENIASVSHRMRMLLYKCLDYCVFFIANDALASVAISYSSS